MCHTALVVDGWTEVLSILVGFVELGAFVFCFFLKGGRVVCLFCCFFVAVVHLFFSSGVILRSDFSIKQTFLCRISHPISLNWRRGKCERVEAPSNSLPLLFASKEEGAAPFPAKHGDDFVLLHTTTCTKQKGTGQLHVKLAGRRAALCSR